MSFINFFGLEVKAVKRILSLTILILVLTTAVCFAAPDTVSPYEEGNATDLIAVTNPQGQRDTTFDGSYVISGYGKEGTVITVYWHDAEADLYKKVYNEVKYTSSNGTVTTALEEASVTVGTSGLFMRSVDLSQGDHNLLIRAENGGSVQHLKISLTRYKRNLINIIKSWAN